MPPSRGLDAPRRAARRPPIRFGGEPGAPRLGQCRVVACESYVQCNPRITERQPTEQAFDRQLLRRIPAEAGNTLRPSCNQQSKRAHLRPAPEKGQSGLILPLCPSALRLPRRSTRLTNRAETSSPRAPSRSVGDLGRHRHGVGARSEPLNHVAARCPGRSPCPPGDARPARRLRMPPSTLPAVARGPRARRLGARPRGCTRSP